MSKITIRNLNNKQLLSHNNSKSVLNIIHENNIDWMHACGGKGRCTTCKMIIHEGGSNLSVLTPFENKMQTSGRLDKNERLACQCILTDDIVISVPGESKLPHITYSDE